jgi:hypothetical protein
MTSVLTRLLPNGAVHRSWQIEPSTGPLEVLRGRTVIVLADLENLCYSARDLGYRLSLPSLANRLRSSARRTALHAFISAPPGTKEQTQAHLQADDWVLHVNPIETVLTHKGLETKANADALMLGLGGILLSRTRAEVLVAASGDGDLVQLLARLVAHYLPKPRYFVTLSLPGSTAFRLDARRNPLIQANLEIGRDCLRSIA